MQTAGSSFPGDLPLTCLQTGVPVTLLRHNYLLERLTELRENIYILTAYYVIKDVIKGTDKQPDGEKHGTPEES